jgi:hypothetical protein
MPEIGKEWEREERDGGIGYEADRTYKIRIG